MKNILFVLALLMPMLGFAQSIAADENFNKGMELIDVGKYGEAIPFFEKSYSNDSLVATLAIAHCLRKRPTFGRGGNKSDRDRDSIYHIIHKRILEKEFIYASALNNLTIYYLETGNFNMAYKLQPFSYSANSYANYYSTLALYESKNVYYYDAAIMHELAASRYIGCEQPNYATSWSNIAKYFAIIGLHFYYKEAIWLDPLLVEISKGHPSSLYYKTISNHNIDDHQGVPVLSELRRIIDFDTRYIYPRNTVNDYDQLLLHSIKYSSASVYFYCAAIAVETQVLEIRRKILGENHPDYASSLNNLANYYAHIGKYNEAKRLFPQALNILDKEHPDYANTLNNLADYNAHLGNYHKAIKLCTQASKIIRKVFGEKHHSYTSSLNNLAHYHFKAGNYKESTEFLKLYFERKKTFILNNFASMTEKERANFWSEYSSFFCNRLPYYACKYLNKTFATLAFNGQLLSKGLLLNAELEIQKLITQSGIKDLENRYITLRSNQAKLNNLYQQPINMRTINVDSVESLIEQDQKYLIKHIKEFGDYTKKLAIKWEDVQNELSYNDIAIEFVNFIDEDSKQEQYIALILKKGMSAPEVVRLSFSENDLANCYQSPSLYNAIWKPIEKYLNGVENVYFAPSGKLHIISIESLPDENGKIFSSKYHAYRLSSTRNLALPKPQSIGKKALLYGNIEYGAAIDSLRKHDRQLDSILKYDKRGDSYSKLYETELEINSIAVSLNKMGYNTNNIVQVKKVNATEYSFKMRSKQNYNIIHLATHGYFKKDTINNYSMLNSGLVFAGAENLKNRPDTIDDGLLTAQEISYLDLKNTDLLVLSACETALGEISSEGVFGLQRGFKKAGVNTIVMSLKKVYDTQTKEFMICFYDKMASGLSKHDAFVAAQQVIREKYKNDNQKKDEWTNFIMLDGDR